MSSLPLPSGTAPDTFHLYSVFTDAINNETGLENYDVHQLRRALDLGGNLRADSPLLWLPPELLEDLLDALPARDIRTCALVCSSLAPLARSRTLRTLRLKDGGSLVRGVWFARYAPGLYRGTRKIIIYGEWIRAMNCSKQHPIPISQLNNELFDAAIVSGQVPSMKTEAEARRSFSEIVAQLERLDVLHVVGVRIWGVACSSWEELLASPCMASITSLRMECCKFQGVGALYDFLALYPDLAYIWMNEPLLMKVNKNISRTSRKEIPLRLIQCSGHTWLPDYKIASTLAHCTTAGSLRAISFDCEPGVLTSLLRFISLKAIELVGGAGETIVDILNNTPLRIKRLTLSTRDETEPGKFESILGNISRLTLPDLKCISIHISNKSWNDTIFIMDETLVAMPRMLRDLGLNCLSFRFFYPQARLGDDSGVISLSPKERVMRYTGAEMQIIWRSTIDLPGVVILGVEEDVELCIETPDGWEGPELIHCRRRGKYCACHMPFA